MIILGHFQIIFQSALKDRVRTLVSTYNIRPILFTPHCIKQSFGENTHCSSHMLINLKTLEKDINSLWRPLL